MFGARTEYVRLILQTLLSSSNYLRNAYFKSLMAEMRNKMIDSPIDITDILQFFCAIFSLPLLYFP